MTSALSLEKKYRIADQLAPHFKNLLSFDRRTAFGVVLNAQLRINGEITSLKDAFTEADAYHITNLVLLRISSNKIIEVDIDLVDEDEVYVRGEDAPF